MAAQEKYEAQVPKDLADLVPDFLANRGRDLDVLASALARGDFNELLRIGHRMKGVGKPYGFAYIGALGRRIEEVAHERDRPAVASLIAEYRAYLGRVRITYT